jgi:hypothetical protein
MGVAVMVHGWTETGSCALTMRWARKLDLSAVEGQIFIEPQGICVLADWV